MKEDKIIKGVFLSEFQASLKSDKMLKNLINSPKGCRIVLKSG
jgi:hypothetical protein